MRKMDEMEFSNTLKAIRIVYLYSVIFEVIYIIGNAIITNEIVSTGMFLLLISQNIVFSLVRYYYKIKVDDPEGKQGIKVFVFTILICIAAGLIIYLVSN